MLQTMRGRRRWLLPAALALLAPGILLAWTITAVLAEDQSPAPSGGALPGDPQKGQQVYSSAGCSQCHGSGLEGGVGPKLAPIEKLPDTGNPLNPDYLITTITNGKSGVGSYGQMPPKGGSSSLGDQDIKDIASFIIQTNRNPGSTPLGPVELARSNVFWITVSVFLMVFVTWLLARYNMRWIARRVQKRQESERIG